MFQFIYCLLMIGFFQQPFNPEDLFNEARQHDIDARDALKNVYEYQSKASSIIDSALGIHTQVHEDMSKMEIRAHLNQIEKLYTEAYKYISKADSATNLADSLKKLSETKTIEAFRIIGQEVEIISKSALNDTLATDKIESDTPVATKAEDQSKKNKDIETDKTPSKKDLTPEITPAMLCKAIESLMEGSKEYSKEDIYQMIDSLIENAPHIEKTQ